MATLPGAWHFRVSAGTGWPGVSILWLGEVESLIFNFYLSVAACKIVRPWDTHTCCWDVKQATNKQILVFLHTSELVKESRVQTVEEKQGWIWCLLHTQWTALPLGHLYSTAVSKTGVDLVSAAHTVDRLTSRSPVLLSQNQGWIPSLLLTQWTALPLGHLYCCLKTRVGSPVCCSHSGPPYL